jgi:hypothetical protein
MHYSFLSGRLSHAAIQDFFADFAFADFAQGDHGRWVAPFAS